MILKRFYDEKLAQASYLVGCPGSGEAIVIDANRDVDQYLAAAAEEGLQITAVTETHIHADFVSGSRELAARTHATLYLSDEGDENWKYAFADQPNVVLVGEGSVIKAGGIRLDVIKTPGHTPEHITFVLTDEPASSKPLGAFTGDFIFVGDVGRPDLLERAAGVEGTMVMGGHALFESLSRFLEAYPDSLLLWPAHGAGSACGKSLGGVPDSSLGYEKSANWGLQFQDAESFVENVLAGQPEPPIYFKEMKRINKVGPALLNGFRTPARFGSAKIGELLGTDAQIVDLRQGDASRQNLIPGSLLVPMSRSFTTWAGWFLSYEKPIYLIADSESQVREAVRDLAMIGLDQVVAWFGPEVPAQYLRSGHRTESLSTVNWEQALDLQATGAAVIIDVRGATEVAAGNVPGTLSIPLGHLERRWSEVPADKTLIFHCHAGSRSLMAAALAKRLGATKVLDLSEGYHGYLMREVRGRESTLA